MRAVFIGVGTLFLIVGMGNDAQAACGAACQAKGSKLNEIAEALPACGREARARWKALHPGRVMSAMELNRYAARCGGCRGYVVGGHCYLYAVP
jgi:hypothetical protein